MSALVEATVLKSLAGVKRAVIKAQTSLPVPLKCAADWGRGRFVCVCACACVCVCVLSLFDASHVETCTCVSDCVCECE